MKKTLLVGMALLSSIICFAQKGTYHFQDTQARLLDVMTNAYVKPLTVELQVLANKHREWTIELTNKDVEQMNGELNNIRSFAIYSISKKEDCDVIVAATINVKSKDDGTGFLINVVGYPANFINWKTATQEDYEWIRMEKTQTTSELDKIKAVVKNKN